MSFSETIFLFVLALVIFGPKKLPEIARQAGKLLNEFRRASNEFKSQIEQEVAHLEVESRQATTLSPATPPQGTAGRTLTLVPGGELPATKVPATSADSPAEAEDEPLFATGAAAIDSNPHNGSGTPSATKSASDTPASNPVAPSTSRESHA